MVELLNQLIQQNQGQIDIGVLFIACFLFPFICAAIWELISKLIKSEQPQQKNEFRYINHANGAEFISFEIK